MSSDISYLLSTEISMISLTFFIGYLGLFLSILSIINLYFWILYKVFFFTSFLLMYLVLHSKTAWLQYLFLFV